jgi:hypothetical protein
MKAAPDLLLVSEFLLLFDCLLLTKVKVLMTFSFDPSAVPLFVVLHFLAKKVAAGSSFITVCMYSKKYSEAFENSSGLSVAKYYKEHVMI